MRPHLDRQGAAVLLLIGLIASAALLGACGGKSKAPGVATAAGATAHPSASPSLSDEERQRQFTQCLRDHGLNVQDSTDGKIQITSSGGPGDKNKADSAMKACQSLAPAGKIGSTPSAEDVAQMRKFAQCMRDHGVAMADPNPDGGMVNITGGKDDTKTQAAMAACQHLMPGANGTSGPIVSSQGAGK